MNTKLTVGFFVCILLAACGGGGSQPAQTAQPEPRPLVVIEFAGQSNAGEGGNGVTLDFSAHQGNALQFSSAGKVGYGFASQSPSDLSAVEPSRDVTPNGQWVQTMAGQPISANNNGADYLLRTDWYGGQPLTSFLPGTYNFSNTIQAMRAAKAIGAARGQPVSCDWYVWIQGESGPTGRDTYSAMLSSYINSVRNGIAAEIGAAPTFVIVQTNVGDWISPQADTTADDSVALAQLDASATPGAILAGPMYQSPLLVDWSDNIHASSIGRMVLGDMLAAVHAAGPSWQPLKPVSAARFGATIDVRFSVPAGPLAFDTQWIKPLPNYGFTYTAGIQGVAIVSADTVRITLANAAPGVLRYAMGAGDSLLDGWASGRGQLISPTNRPSYWHQLGYAVPATVNHYSVRFEMNID